MATATIAHKRVDVGPFAHLRPSDGYHAVRREGAGVDAVLEVWLELRSGPDVCYVRRVWQKQATNLQPEDYGEQSRVYAFWQAVARFLNAGGKMETLIQTVDVIRADDDFAEVIWPAEFVLVDTMQELETCQHIFGNLETQAAVVWAEDQFVEITTLGDLANNDAEEPVGLVGAETTATYQSFDDLPAQAADC